MKILPEASFLLAFQRYIFISVFTVTNCMVYFVFASIVVLIVHRKHATCNSNPIFSFTVWNIYCMWFQKGQKVDCAAISRGSFPLYVFLCNNA